MNSEWQPLRPGYHVTVPYGWMNDPHGMFELNGTTHVFIQYNPRAIAWGTFCGGVGWGGCTAQMWIECCAGGFSCCCCRGLNQRGYTA